MTEQISIKPPRWFWAVVVIALIWNLLGVIAYLGTVYMSPEAFEALSPEQQDLMKNTPPWVTGAFALGVFAGALGCMLLLLRKSLAFYFLGISLVGVLVQNYYYFTLTAASEIYGSFQGLIMPVLVIVISLLLVLLARSAQLKGWIY